MPTQIWKKRAANVALYILQVLCTFACILAAIFAILCFGAILSLKAGIDELYRLRTGEDVYEKNYRSMPAEDFLKDVMWNGVKPAPVTASDGATIESGDDHASSEEPEVPDADEEQDSKGREIDPPTQS